MRNSGFTDVLIDITNTDVAATVAKQKISLREPSQWNVKRSHHATAHPVSWRYEVRFWWEQSGLGPSFHLQHLCCHPRPLSQAYT